MIRPYRTIPRFDDGWDYNAALQAGLNYQQYPQEQQFTVAPTPGYNFLAPPTYEEPNRSGYTDEAELEDNAILAKNIQDFQRDLERRNQRPVRPIKKVTTAVQDRRAAQRAYESAVRAADKKAAAENKAAKSEIKKNEAVLKRNGLKTETGKYGTVYSAYADMQAGAVGRKKTNQSYKAKPFQLGSSYTPNKVVRKLTQVGHSIYEENRKKRQQMQNITQKQKDAARAKARSKAQQYAKSRRGPGGQAPGGWWNPLNWGW